MKTCFWLRPLFLNETCTKLNCTLRSPVCKEYILLSPSSCTDFSVLDKNIHLSEAVVVGIAGGGGGIILNFAKS